MRNKIVICVALLLGFAGVAGASYAHSEQATFKVADRAAT
ncbi:putative membrane protein [Bacillus atrophaeus subsp. globigii]|uniref:Uncharacterized protein n=1 Tax=Bacillus atrophaeus (strain 1942) TaxID=720555 RepID=A0ABM5LU13_BACA1|nr:hypothetical protein BATR1942_01320 [Bacillus atrophaeus 1942]AIK47010.1 putative membrane protein [Bacillus atrophaeus subsp. globigii]EIM09408.1 hypothetical protein UY9_17481 [Bacillus atrophaeus C89]KFK81285.1 putative membrane protein [Bacillus atrophaeus]